MKSDIKRVNEIAENVIAKKISKDDGANEIIEILYRNKALFGLNLLDQDNLHDYILHLRKKIIHLFDVFNIRYGCSFVTFLHSSIDRSLISWKKQRINLLTVQESYNSFETITYEDQICNYRQEEDSFIERLNEVHSNELSYGVPTKSLHEFFTRPSQEARTKPLTHNERMYILQKEACLLLALKLSYYIDDDTIKKVCKITGVSENELIDVICKINESMQTKIERHEKCIRSRNKAFFFHRKFMLQQEKLNNDSPLAKDTARKFERQTEYWKSRNKLLTQNRYMAIPTNTIIGKILNIDSRRIGYIIRQAELNIDSISADLYHGEYEDIFSNRKPKQKSK